MMGWTDLDADQELLSVTMDRRIYEQLRAHGKPRELIVEALALEDRPVRGIRISNIAPGEMVTVNVAINEFVAEGIRRSGGLDYVLEKIVRYLGQLRPPEPVEPQEPTFLGIDI